MNLPSMIRPAAFVAAVMLGALAGVAASPDRSLAQSQPAKWKCRSDNTGCMVGDKLYCQADCGKKCECSAWDPAPM